jgi:hypothetical protein
MGCSVLSSDEAKALMRKLGSAEDYDMKQMVYPCGLATGNCRCAFYLRVCLVQGVAWLVFTKNFA